MVYADIDDMTDKKMIDPTIIWKLKQYAEVVDEWIEEQYSEDSDRSYIWKRIKTDPIYAYHIWLLIKQRVDYEYREWKKIHDLAHTMANQKGKITIVVGAKGSGKTAFAYSLGELIAKEKSVWYYGLPIPLPKFFKGYKQDINDIPDDSTIICDEGGILFFNRERGDEKTQDFIKKLATIRHRGINIILITQSASIVDVNFLRMADALIFTSKFFFKIARERMLINEYLKELFPIRRGDILYYTNDTILEVKYNLPSWWCEKYSVPFTSFKNDTDKNKFMLNISNLESEKMQQFMLYRGVELSIEDIKLFKMFVESQGLEKLQAMKNEELNLEITRQHDETSINDILKGDTSLNQYEFEYMDNVDRESWNQEFLKDENLSLYAQHNTNLNVIDAIKKAIKHHNVIISIYGATGSGKSLSALSIAECVTQITKSKLYCFQTREGLLENMKNVKKHDVLLLDEDIKRFGSGSGREIMEMQNLEKTLRQQQIHFIFCSPSLETHLHRFVLRTFQLCRDPKTELIKYMKLMVYNENKKPIGFITLKCPNKKILDEYLPKKETFTKSVMDRTVYKKTSLDNIVDELSKDPKFKQVQYKQDMYAYITIKYPHLSLSEREIVFAKTKFIREGIM